jgi:hypothetical protein
MASDISVTINPPAQIGVTIADGVPKHSATHAPEGSDSLSAYYVTGSVVRPSETGNFILASQTGQFVGTGQTGFYTGVFYPYSSNPNGYVQGAVVRPSNTGGFLDTGSSQTVNSLKNFLVRPTVSGTGVLLSGEAVTNSQTGQFVGTGQTGSFITSSQTGTFVGTDQTGFYTGVFYPYSSNPNGYVQGSVVRPSNTGAFLDTGSSQTINSLKNFLIRPTVNGTGVLLSGETPNSVNTGVLTGVFYPLNSNPNGYITGVDLSNYVTKSSTGIFVTTGQTGNFITASQTGGFVSTGSTGSFITSSQTGQFVSTGSTGSFVTGSVVRPSETGNFITASQTGQFVGTGATGGFAVNTQVVFVTGNQNISGVKNFYSRPTVNGTGVLLSGEATALPTTILYTTGNQIKSGRLIIGDTIVDSSYPYTLSLQSNNQDTFLEILNSGGAGEGVFFGINNNDFEQYNWQGGDIVFFTAEIAEAGYARLIIKNDGKVGIGTSSPSEKLDVSGNIKANGATFNTRPTVNGTGVLLSGEAAGAANTGSLTGVFYPLNSNPSGYITGVDLSAYVTGSVVRPSETGNFITVSQTGAFYPISNPSGFITGVDLSSYVTTGQTGQFVTGSVVRPSETGNFITTGQTGQFVWTGATGSFVTTGQTGVFLVSGSAVDTIHLYGKNDQGSTIYKGNPVYIGGANGANPLIKLASNTGEPTSSKTIGLLAQDLLVNEFGYIITEGILEGFDTSSGNVGDPMWLGTGGNIIYGLANKPYGNNHLVYLGVVLRSNNDNGKVYVKVQNGFEIEELHRVYAKNASTNDTLMYNSGSGAWFARQINTGDVSGISAYALAANTGSFITTGQTGQFVSTGSTGSFVVSSATGAFLTTGAADGRYYGLADGQTVSGVAATGFNDAITGMTITGDTTKFITLFQRDGTTITGSFADNAGTGGGGTSGSINVNDSNLVISISMFA